MFLPLTLVNPFIMNQSESKHKNSDDGKQSKKLFPPRVKKDLVNLVKTKIESLNHSNDFGSTFHNLDHFQTPFEPLSLHNIG